LLVAYSGGGDSTGLLVALAEALKANDGLDIALTAATVDHGLRPDSAHEARAVGALCERLGIVHHILTWKGEKPSTGIQAAARQARYGLLHELASTIAADLVVTAHNLDDQQETLAMRRARSPQASGGISEAVLVSRRTWVLRPFLSVRRDDIRAYLTERHIGWVDDPSNDNEKFERVRVRRSLAATVERIDVSARRASALETANRLRSSSVIHPGRVAMVDLSDHDADNPAHLDAIRHLAAMMGGRAHLAGGEASQRIRQFLASVDSQRLSSERVVFDRRRQFLYICRERRSLPEMVIEPGSTTVWDNRFRFHNSGAESVVIGVRGRDRKHEEVFSHPPSGDLPGAVKQLIEATEPILLQGRRDLLTVKPIIAQFDEFLPADVLEIGNALAFLGGLDHFPELPTR
jgi:tRNA(Ile)-lysidine synthase